jgi:hypothetical protein
MKTQKHFIEVKEAGKVSDKSATLDVVDTNEFILDVDGKSYRFDITRDGKIGIHLMNGVDLKVTNPPAFSYPAPYIVLG